MLSPIRWHGPQRYMRSTSGGREAPSRRQVENIPQGRFTHYLQAHQWARLELHTAKDTTLFECCSNERAH